MPERTLASIPADAKLEDGSASLIHEGLGKVAEGMGTAETAETMARYISVSHCEDCNRYWLKEKLHSTPGWMPNVYGRGRRIDAGQVYRHFESAGIKYDGACETCVFKRVPTYAEAILTLPNKEMRRFFKLYALKIEQMKEGRGYADSVGFRFHIAVATILVRRLPAKQRKSFATLAEILATMEIL